jgi:glycerol-3-phosphate acyltransferase PlsY
MLNFFLMVFCAYLVGSIPTAIILGKIFKGIDIRQHGSGNAGATNVFRVLGWQAGLIVLLIDMGKGLLATLLIYKIAQGSVAIESVLLQIISGLAAIFGHIWTVFAGFKGGKGVGTGAGMIIGLTPGAVLLGIIIFLITVVITRYVSLGSILGSLSIPAYLFVRHVALNASIPTPLLIFGIFVPLLIIFTHRSNIERIMKGTENKFRFSKT